MLTTVNGLVTRVYPSGNHDRVIHLLTAEHGRMAVMVKGAGSGKSKSAAAVCTQLFTYGNYELYRGKSGELYWFRGGSVLASFFELSRDVTRMALAAYLCDVASDLAVEDGEAAESETLLRMLLNSLYALGTDKYPAIRIKSAFELRAVSLMGYRPDLTACDICHETNPGNAYLDILNGRLICADCQTKRNRLYRRSGEGEEGERHPVCAVSASVLAAMRYILTAPDKKLFSFALGDREEEYGLANAAETFLLYRLERDFETLRFYHSVAD